jgi:hypothetical protein
VCIYDGRMSGLSSQPIRPLVPLLFQMSARKIVVDRGMKWVSIK